MHRVVRERKAVNLAWIKAAGIRALKTFAQTLAAAFTINASFGDIDWKNSLSVAGVAFIYSLITSIKGLPELETDGVIEIDTKDPNKDTYRLVLDDSIDALVKKPAVSFKVISR